MSTPLASSVGKASLASKIKHTGQTSLRYSAAALSGVMRSYGLCLSLISLLVISVLSSQHQLTWLDNKLLHSALQLTPSQIGTPQVLILETPYTELGTTQRDWRSLSSTWLAQGAQRVAISFPIPAEQKAQLADFIAQGKVVLANPAALDERHTYWQAASGHATAPDSGLAPNYRFPPAAIPSLSLQRAISEGILPSLVQHKVILIGYAHDENLRALPWLGSAQGISPLRQDALQVDSLLQQNGIQSAPWPSRILSVGLLAAVLLLLWQRSAFKFAILQLIATVLISSVIAIAVLARANYWLPLAEILLIATSTFCCVFYAKMQADDKKLRMLISNTSGKLHKLSLPPAIFQTPDHWQFILRLIDQTLHAKRVILLEKIPGQHHLQEVHGVHEAGAQAAPHGLREMRRDARRAPYSTAWHSKSLCEVENFLQPTAGNAQEKQYVLPLLLNGELLGFLALGVAAEESDYFDNHAASLTPIADQVAKLLYQRQLWLSQQSQPRWQRWLQDSNHLAYQKLTQAVSMMEQRLALLEHSFAQGTHAAIVYDLFGRILLANRHMQQRMAHSSIGLQNLNASHFLARLSGKNLAEVRGAMQELILRHNSFTWPVSLPELVDEHLLVRVSVLKASETLEEQVQPFDLAGILVEVMDVSEMMVSVDAHAEIRQQAAHHLHEDLQNLPAMLRALSNEKIAPAIFQRVVGALQAKAESIAAITTKSRLLLENENRNACYPLDVTGLLQKVALEANLQTALTQKNVQLNYRFHADPAHAFGVPKELKFCLQAIVQLLLLDASSDSCILVASCDDSQYLSLRFSNEGYGISNQKLQTSLHDAAARAQTPAYAQAFEACGIVASWGGSLSFSSAIGAGTKAHLQLAAFCWRSPASEELLMAQIAQARVRAEAQGKSDANERFPRPRLVK